MAAKGMVNWRGNAQHTSCIGQNHRVAPVACLSASDVVFLPIEDGLQVLTVLSGDGLHIVLRDGVAHLTREVRATESVEGFEVCHNGILARLIRGGGNAQ